MTAESTDFWYWPCIDPALAYGLYERSRAYWFLTYGPWHIINATDVLASNVSVASINAQIDIMDPSGVILERFPGGFMSPALDWYTGYFISFLDAWPIASGEPLDGYEKLHAMAVGMAVWNMYKLALGMQAQKVNIFGLRGRDDDPV
jgi:hypothetical protein